ncbi:hypothetical protein FSP39_003216 [Pinctada imbricata]|uniref:Uncharacterized protein n=1 Tax=Pinctada imbricata TaxID=66713 RepID=A0AA88XE93_PINIB|nr:hypothetical protein FSP39_003216 [Pinctada imbricata]
MAEWQDVAEWETISTSGMEWNVFLRELHDAIQQQLTESHVQYFSDLSEAEKELFMQRATKALEGGSAYTNLYKKVSVLMDQNLNEEVSRQLLEDAPMDTKSDLIIENAEEGALSLLRKWPDMKDKLHICLNQPLPLPLRQTAWRLHLNNSRVRKQYIDLLSANPRAAISEYDYEISQRCEQLIKSEPTLADLRGSVGIFYGMKAVLSYYHSSMKTKNRLRDVDHLLIVPFMHVSAPNISKKEPPPGRVVALLVEEFKTFMEGRPGFVIDSGSEAHTDEVMAFVDKVAKMLQAKHPDACKVIAEKYSPSKEKIVATETGSFALLTEALLSVVRPMIRSMFVTYLKPDTLLYVWDQYVIGQDTPGFPTEWLTIVTVTILGLVKEKLKEANSPAAMEKILKEEVPKLTIPQLQYEVKQHHYKELYSMLTRDSKAAVPVLDPTQALHPPWRHWYNDVIPPYTKPQDRRKAREEREAERERFLQQQKDLETHRREQDARDRRDEEEEYLRMAAADRQRVEQERIRLEEQIEEERRRRLEAEQRAADEIEQLKRQIAALQNQKPCVKPKKYVFTLNEGVGRMRGRWVGGGAEGGGWKGAEGGRKGEIRVKGREERGRWWEGERDTLCLPPPPLIYLIQEKIQSPHVYILQPTPSPIPSRASYISRILIPPPPSRASRPPTVPAVIPVPRTPTPAKTPVEQKNQIVTDFLQRVLLGVNKVAHADSFPREKAELDGETEGYLQQNVKDIKRAQKEIFGHYLKPGEFDGMDPKRQQETSEKMIKLMQKWREERRAKDLEEHDGKDF